MRERIQHGLSRLSRGDRLALLGSVLAIFTTLMPWNTVGTLALNTQHAYNGFQDQNLIVGVITFIFMLAACLLISLPLFGIQLPRLPWRKSSVLFFLGGESALLIFVLIFMYATGNALYASYGLRLGIQLALLTTASVFLGAYLIRMDELVNVHGRTDLLTRTPRGPHQLDLSQREEKPVDHSKLREDARVRLDI